MYITYLFSVFCHEKKRQASIAHNIFLLLSLVQLQGVAVGRTFLLLFFYSRLYKYMVLLWDGFAADRRAFVIQLYNIYEEASMKYILQMFEYCCLFYTGVGRSGDYFYAPHLMSI